jgi:cysteine desulfurase
LVTLVSDRVFLDHAAGSRVRPEAFERAASLLDLNANASSVHLIGRQARKAIEVARTQVASLVRAKTRGIVFTSCASEANALALSPTLLLRGRTVSLSRIYVTAVEHPSVLRGGRFSEGFQRKLPVDANGLIRTDIFGDFMREEQRRGGIFMVSVQLVNSETGVIQPVADIARIVHAAGGYVHCDAVQAAGKLPIDVGALGVDFLTLSAHKLGGIQGAGALVLGDPDLTPAPLLTGGAQENNLRAGTENVPAIAAFGAAAQAAQADLGRMGDFAQLRDWLERELRATSAEVVVFGAGAPRVATISCFAVPGIIAETSVIALDLQGVAVSAGSACSAGKVGTSHVLQAYGAKPILAKGGLRVSLGWNTSPTEVARFVVAWRNMLATSGTRSGSAHQVA